MTAFLLTLLATLLAVATFLVVILALELKRARAGRLTWRAAYFRLLAEQERGRSGTDG